MVASETRVFCESGSAGAKSHPLRLAVCPFHTRFPVSATTLPPHVQVGVHVGVAFDHEFVVCDRGDVMPSSSRHGANLRDAVKRRFATIYGEIAFEKRAREE